MPVDTGWKIWESGPWELGVRTMADPINIPQGMLARAEGVEFDTEGLVTKRSGRARWNTLAISGSVALDHIAEYVVTTPTSGAASFMVISSGKLWKGDANAFVSQMGGHANFGASPIPDFAQMLATAGAQIGKDVFLGVSGVAGEPPFYWVSGGSVTDIATPAPTGGVSCCVAGQRFWVAANMTIYWSEVGDPMTFLSASSLTINSSDGQRIICIRPSGTNILVLKERGVHFFPVAVAATPASTSVTRVRASVGNVALHTVTPAQVDDDYWFLTQDLDIAALSELAQTGDYKPTTKSYTVMPTLQTLSRASSDAYLKRAAACKYGKKSKYLFAGATGSQTQNGTLVVLNYRRPDGHIIAAVDPNLPPLASLFESINGNVYGGGYDGFLYTLDTGQTDSVGGVSTAITGLIETGWSDFSTPRVSLAYAMKQVKAIEVYVKGTGDFSLTCVVEVGGVEKDAAGLSGTFITGDTVTLSKAVGTGLGGYQIIGANINSPPGRLHNIRLSNAADAPVFNNHKILVYYEVTGSIVALTGSET